MGGPPISRDSLTYHDHMDKFNQYAESLKTYQKDNQKKITISHHGISQEVPVKAALQELMKAYGQLRKYENPDMPLIKNQLQGVLRNKELKKEYPLRRLLFKIQKTTTALIAKIASMRGKLKVPELKPAEPRAEVPPHDDTPPKPTSFHGLFNPVFIKPGEPVHVVSPPPLKVVTPPPVGLVVPPPFPERDLLNAFNREVFTALEITLDNPKFHMRSLTIEVVPSDQDKVTLKVRDHSLRKNYNFEVVFEENKFVIKDLATDKFVADLRSNFDRKNVVNQLVNYIDANNIPAREPSIQDLKDRIGLKSKVISGHRGRLDYFVRSSNADPKAVTVSIFDSFENNRSFIRFYVAGDQVKAFYVDENGENQPNPVETIPLSEIRSPDHLFEIAVKHANFKTENLKSNAQKLLDQIGKVDFYESVEGYPGLICRIRKSESTDAVTIFTYNSTQQGAIFRLYLEGDQVYMKELSTSKGTTVDSFPLSELSKEKVLGLASKHSGLVKEFGVGEATVLARMFASVQWDKDQIQLKAIQMGFDPAKKVGDYLQEQIDAFLAYYDAGKNVNYSQDTTIERLIKKVEASKHEGLVTKEAHAAMSHVLRSFLDSDKASSEDKKLFKVIQERMEEQFDYEWTGRRILKQALAYGINAQELAHEQAREILAKADLPKYKTIGPFLSAGWSREGGGHHINVETLRVGDKYHIIVSNAGAGVGRGHRPVYEYDAKGNLITTYQEVDERGNPLEDDKGNPIIKEKMEGITIKTYETDAAGAEKILADVLIFNTQLQEPTASKDFYDLFDKATPIEDYRILPRRLQDIGNCAVKSQEEAYFYICQRLGRTSAANAFLNFLDEELLRVAKHYPALRDDLKKKGKKPPVQPLLEGSSIFVLHEMSPTKGRVEHRLPLGSKEEQIFPIGREEMVALTKPEGGISRRHAVLIQKNGKYYLRRHEKCHPDNTVGCIRGGKLHTVKAGESYEVRKGDVIDLSGYRLTVS